MPNPSVTEPVKFTGRYGSTISLNGDYGGLTVGNVTLDGDAARDFVCEAAAILLESEKREQQRVRDLADDEDEADAAAEAAADLEDEAPESECRVCGYRITLLSGSWVATDGTRTCRRAGIKPFVPHKPKDG